MSKPVSIYFLSSSADPENIRYIGFTNKKLENRKWCHEYDSTRHDNIRCQWIRSVKANGHSLVIGELETTDTTNAFECERFWIAQVKNWGFQLVNSNNGGGGKPIRSEEEKKKLSERNKGNKYRLGKTHTAETRKLISEAHKDKPGGRLGQEVLEKTRQKMSLAKLGKEGNRKGKKCSSSQIEALRKAFSKPIYQIKKDGTIIEWNSAKKIKLELHIGSDTLKKALKNNQIVRDCTWKYKNEEQCHNQ